MKADIAAKINQVKAEKNAVILGHNYSNPRYFIRFRTSSEIPLIWPAAQLRQIRTSLSSVALSSWPKQQSFLILPK